MRLPAFIFTTCCAIASPAAVADTASTATIKVASGPAAGTYTYVSSDPCILAPLRNGGPITFAHVLMADASTLSVDIPNTNASNVNEFQIELVVAKPDSNASRLRTKSTTLTIDTRPDGALEPYQRQERGSTGMTGRGTATLHLQASSARLVFQGQTAAGVRIEGSLECRKLDREFGR
jgi:hypothetical protein